MTKLKERKEGRSKDRKWGLWRFFKIIFKEKKNQSEKERKKEQIAPHRERKEKKADKLSGKHADVTTERLFQFLSWSAWLYIFWIYIDSNKEEKVKESPFLRLNKIQPLLSMGVF